MDKPRQSMAALWNISFGFFGIQIAFALQNANVSRIFQSLGGEIDQLAFLWIAGPVTGLLVQPIIGHYSDRTWSRFGRRRPFFLGGAILAALALVGMPHAGVLLTAAIMLWLLDASLNISMEPFRAFVGDMLGKDQQTAGYAFQTAFIGAGAVVGSLAPELLNMAGVANTAPAGIIPPSVRFAFYIGAAAILIAVLWTVLTTREYPPEQMATFAGRAASEHEGQVVAPANGPLWALAGVVLSGAVYALALDKAVYVLGGALVAFGLARVAARAMAAGGSRGALVLINSDLAQMPPTMRRLALVQFFTWSALFILWIYTTPVVTQVVFGSTDPTSAAYNQGANWVGVLFASYNGVATIGAFLLPWLAGRIGKVRTHVIGLLSGAAGFATILVTRDAQTLLVAMVFIGIAWASILTMPYAILAGSLDPRKYGIYMGLFNIFIVVPQLIVATVMGAVINAFFPGAPVWTMAIGAGVMILAAAAMLRVREE
ncbi:MFS transporter [Sphingomonas sp. Y38-1Y]|uniref:MFS transporter n=1 Tax=Sphingomonas sp. Y38-1Y TaxID=3078265 RepID=UPI0028E50317|nr:MFS transporter [Sphingomonas sp. Y38-1Y]